MTDKFGALRATREPGAASHFTDFIANKEPRCPHCGEVIDIGDHELWQLYDDQDQDIECPHCDREFHVQVHVSYSYSTDDQPAEYDDDDEPAASGALASSGDGSPASKVDGQMNEGNPHD